MSAPTFELDPGDEQYGALRVPWRGLRPGQTISVEIGRAVYLARVYEVHQGYAMARKLGQVGAA